MYEHMRGMRNDKDMSQKQVADLLQVHQTTYSDYELGNISIPAQQLKRLAEFYDTSIDYLLDFTDERKPYPRRKE
ncbi:helix-turn-helix transcriptional regulator [Agathobaculum sp. NSJ-28]|jgi:transcriptional regulator with XRE-family HTH domain|uniref:Helix-turn-helix transcriptional regulator n=2 Tax=Agathobaculum TaxID=2048137 RepID=A0A923LX90_9FIRM|nr:MULTISPECIES: helix-turn-helix transcriptional regulator [Agathobaculum]MBC5726378.1 helix-turn-helix transcriptional regulator [Agathobaculum faecis]MCU6789907.1 helix-turn-helix domain-containing protein [Agathobaculum ammoniilyticum]SCJ42898.1 Helix-turn-helix domain [uncultured Butyricicoccus sp.]